MDTSNIAAIMVTERDFDRAIMMNMVRSLQNPNFEGRPDAAMLYTMGGVAFARDVKNILFGKEEHHDQ